MWLPMERNMGVWRLPTFLSLAYILYLFLVAESKTSTGKRFILLENKEVIGGRTAEVVVDKGNRDILCCAQCAKHTGCSAVAIKENSSLCLLLFENLACLEDYIGNSYAWKVYKEDKNHGNCWTLIFRGAAGAGTHLLKTFKGEITTTNPIECQDVTNTSCRSYYRSSLIDNWVNEGIREVKLNLYKSEQTVAMVTLDGRGSNYMSWFAKERLLSTSWNGLSKASNVGFYIEGGPRSFAIYRLAHCSQDHGFLMVSDVSDDVRPCVYEGLPSYPQFFYSVSHDTTVWITGVGYSLADTFAIYVKR